jgi:hypothetical protein
MAVVAMYAEGVPSAENRCIILEKQINMLSITVVLLRYCFSFLSAKYKNEKASRLQVRDALRFSVQCGQSRRCPVQFLPACQQAGDRRG